MKKFLILAALVAVAFIPAVAQADTVKAGDIVQVQAGVSRYNNGGEFTLFDMTNPAVPANFPTFCLETNEYLNFGVNLRVLSVTDRAISGGTGGNASGFDLLDTRSAFIYTQYRNGNQYEWTGADVQQAIWWIEEERTSAGAPIPPSWVSNGDLDDYIDAADWTGIGNVRVLNISYGGATTGQDLLTLVPVPDGGATLTLLGGVLMGLGVLRRKFRG